MIHDLGAITLRRPRPATARLLEEAAIRLGRRLLSGKIEGSLLVTLPSGRRVRIGEAGGGIDAELRLANYRLAWKALRRGAIGFAESHIDGDTESPDLVSVFRFFVRNEPAFRRAGRGLFKVRLRDRLGHLARANTRGGSRRNIAEHYDLGNDFFAAWLDGELHYSSGFYETGAATLEDAQAAKQDLVATMLEAAKGDRVLEIGCGWGGTALGLAARGSSVIGITLSREQLSHARRRAERLGLTDRCRFLLQDYRDATGTFDRIVSIEMVEAVGEAYWPIYFRALHDRLRPGGIAVVQAITIDEARFEEYRRSADFIQRHVFPGGMLPTVEAIGRQARAAGLVLERDVRFGPSYALTLREWRRRFEAQWPKIEALGHDGRFRRLWRYYLAYCEAGFLDGMIDVGVYRFSRKADGAPANGPGVS